MASVRPERLPVDGATADAVAAALKLVGFFPEFNAELSAKVFPRSGVYHYRPGELIIDQGENGRDLFLILAGEVAVKARRDGAEVEIERLGEGALIGEMALLSDGVRTATVACVKSVFAFLLAYEDVLYLLENNRALSEHLTLLACARAGR